MLTLLLPVPGARCDAALRDGAVEVWRAALATSGTVPSSERVDRVRAKVGDADALVMLADRGEPAGMVLLEPHLSSASWVHVSMVFVHPRHQRAGVGVALLGEALRRAAAAGRENASVWTRDSNLPAHALYQSLGFTMTEDVGRTPGCEVTHRWERAGKEV